MWRWACAAAAVALLCSLARTDELGGPEKADTPFVLGSRYGRSAPRVMSPRNDRFFMSSRYGKRSKLPSAGGARVAAAPWRPPAPCDCRPYRAALLALQTPYTRSPAARSLFHED